MTQLDRKEVNHTQYDNAAWAYLQADRNGERRAYQFLKDLLKLTYDPI